ncbi:shikimate kinase [Gracilibacillus caseinilyticus]|uniref:Shikimate kinase n=1 Tax=Gracilibacillus caseinilyticus TaxID=2932256 RepID=A0ABY4EU15_9BACI|nr:shikimate kinase [Gracilibacillus caseinilyticus]UOQ47465.1 shikimate kinase [Gracilibacillus caseinilyticus]
MKSIYLVGFMGSGKTSIAECLHKALGWGLQDTDQMIVDYYQMSIPTIFEQKGEAVFRKYEANMLHNTTAENTIVATGGGIIENEENRQWLINQGNIIFLQTSWEEIERRLQHDSSRPIWNNQSRDKQKLLEDRTPKYLEVASHVIQTDNKTEEMIASEIISNIHA